MKAIWNDDALTVEELLRENHDLITWRDDNGRTLLSWAAQHGNINIIKILLKNGAEINSLDSESKNTPLHIAIIGKESSNIEIAQYLIENGADLLAHDIEERTPLDLLANLKIRGCWESGYGLLVDSILAKGVSFEQLPTAAALGKIDDVKKLVESNCGLVAEHSHIDMDDALDFSLKIATFLKRKEIFEYLFPKVKNINNCINGWAVSWSVDWDNNTVLDIALDSSSDEGTISFLRAAGAETRDEIMECINQAQQDVRAIQNFASLIKKQEKP